MNYTVGMIVHKVSKPFLYVDYNEIIAENTVMLCQTDRKIDYFGKWVEIFEGLELIGYQEDENTEGTRNDIILEGTCVLNTTQTAPHVKWLLKGNEKGIRYMREIMESGL